MWDEFTKAMDWFIWTLLFLVLLCTTFARKSDDDAELKESFYRLLEYDDDFEDYLRSRQQGKYADGSRNGEQFDPDDYNLSNVFPKQFFDGLKNKKKEGNKIKDVLDNMHKGRKNNDETDELFRKSDILKPRLHKKVVSYAENAAPSDVDTGTSQNADETIHSSNLHDDSIEFKKPDIDDISAESITSYEMKKDNKVVNTPSGPKEEAALLSPSVKDDAANSALSAAVPAAAATTSLPKTQVVSSKKDTTELNDMFFVVIVVACSLACIAGLTLAAYCWYRLRREAKEAEETESAPFTGGQKGDKKLRKSDEKLAKSAEMYHYVHSKNQLTAMHSKDSAKDAGKHDASDSSEDEGDNTIYECSGLAPPGDMKVVNPLFSDADIRQGSDAKSDGSGSPLRDVHTPASGQTDEHNLSRH